MPFSRPSCGFTLAELLMVLAIFSVLAGISMTAMPGLLASSRRQAALETVLGTLEEGRALALAQGTPVHLVFAGRDRLALFRQPDDYDLPPRQISGWQRLPDGVALANLPDNAAAFPGDEALAHLTFGPTGELLTLPASARIELLTPTGGKDAIVISRLTGRSQLER